MSNGNVEGIDISNWQGNFDWGAAVSWGIGFGIAKASEGVGYTDAQWRNNQAALLAPGPLVGGSYHFARPDLGNSPQAEADWYLSVHDPAVFNPQVPWIFMLDAESAGGSNAWKRAFLDRVNARIGYKCWFYSYPSWITSRGITPDDDPLNIADPNSGKGNPVSVGWPVVTCQQYGLNHGVDADVFLGDRTALLTLAGTQGDSEMPQSDDILRLLLFGEDPAYASTSGNPAGWSAPGGKGHLTRVAEVILANQGAILRALGVEKAEVDAMLTAVKTPAPVDVQALAAALAPHLPPSVDPAEVAKDVLTGLGKALSGNQPPTGSPA